MTILSLIMMEYITHTILMNCITPMSNCIPTLQWPYYYHIEQWPPGHATWTEEELQRVFQGTERLRAEREEVLDPTVSGWWGRGTPCWLGKNLHFMQFFVGFWHILTMKIMGYMNDIRGYHWYMLVDVMILLVKSGFRKIVRNIIDNHWSVFNGFWIHSRASRAIVSPKFRYKLWTVITYWCNQRGRIGFGALLVFSCVCLKMRCAPNSEGSHHQIPNWK